MVRNPPANAGDMGFFPDLGRTPHAVEQLSSCATSTEPVPESPGAATTEARVPYSLCSATEATISSSSRTAEWPLLSATRESLCSSEDLAQPKK